MVDCRTGCSLGNSRYPTRPTYADHLLPASSTQPTHPSTQHAHCTHIGKITHVSLGTCSSTQPTIPYGNRGAYSALRASSQWDRGALCYTIYAHCSGPYNRANVIYYGYLGLCSCCSHYYRMIVVLATAAQPMVVYTVPVASLPGCRTP